MSIKQPEPFRLEDHDLTTRDGLTVALEATTSSQEWSLVYDNLPDASRDFWFPVAVQSGLMSRMKRQWGHKQPTGTFSLDGDYGDFEA